MAEVFSGFVVVVKGHLKQDPCFTALIITYRFYDKRYALYDHNFICQSTKRSLTTPSSDAVLETIARKLLLASHHHLFFHTGMMKVW